MSELKSLTEIKKSRTKDDAIFSNFAKDIAGILNDAVENMKELLPDERKKVLQDSGIKLALAEITGKKLGGKSGKFEEYAKPILDFCVEPKTQKEIKEGVVDSNNLYNWLTALTKEAYDGRKLEKSGGRGKGKTAKYKTISAS
jgi:hypothetical protein